MVGRRKWSSDRDGAAGRGRVDDVSASHGRPPELSVVVPAFNEARRLPLLLDALRSHLDPGTAELIVVDDGSQDATAAVATEALAGLPRAHVLRLPRNHGKGGALRAGVRATTGRVVAYMDADLATDLTSLDPLLRGLEHADVSIGSRAHDASVVRSSRLNRAIMGRTFNRITRKLAGFDHLDTQCGFKAFRRPVAKLLFENSRVDGFALDVEILHLAHALGFRVVETPVDWKHVDGSKIRPWTDSFRMMTDTLQVTSRRRTPFVLPGLALGGADRPAVAEAVRQLDEDPLVASNDEAIEVLLTPTETAQAPRLRDHFRDFGISATPVRRASEEFIGARRAWTLSIGVPQTVPA
jgi:dolichyl-phosphate beta-glucosyltransferase